MANQMGLAVYSTVKLTGCAVAEVGSVIVYCFVPLPFIYMLTDCVTA